MNLYLDTFSFIMDIWPGSENPFDERNKLFIYLLLLLLLLLLSLLLLLLLLILIWVSFINTMVLLPINLKKYK